MSKNFDPLNWYWAVDGATAQVYSSKTGQYVSVSDSNYVAWAESGGVATKIISADMLVLRIQILENSITQRRIREAVLATDGGWLAAVETQIDSLRQQL